MSIADTELLSVAEVAELLKVNQQTVRNWIDDGKLTLPDTSREWNPAKPTYA